MAGTGGMPETVEAVVAGAEAAAALVSGRLLLLLGGCWFGYECG